MYRYFLYLSYRGTHYFGWQKQKNAPTVQAKIEEALSIICKHEIEVTGTGRTDTGVHARQYVAHFDVNEPLYNIPEFLHSINAILPHDIAISDVKPVKLWAHARFSAINRTYQYHIITHKNPFLQEYAWLIHYKLDLEEMNKAAKFLTEIDDFTAFAKLHSNNKTNLCRVYQSIWQSEREELIYTISANRFLRNMVRAIVGNLVDVGRGKRSLDDFKNRVKQGDRYLASISAPAHGLYFKGVAFPESIFL